MDVTVHVDRNQADAPDDESFRIWVMSALSGDHSNRPVGDSAELSIQLVNSDQMADFNTRYRDKHADTNVLSFPVDADLQDRTGLLGDLILCDEVINREARNKQSRESITGRTSRFMACFIYWVTTTLMRTTPRSWKHLKYKNWMV